MVEREGPGVKGGFVVESHSSWIEGKSVVEKARSGKPLYSFMRVLYNLIVMYYV